MSIATLSKTFQIAIPKEIRSQAGLKAGTAFEIIAYGERIELIPLQPMQNLFGIFKGIDTNIERDTDRV